ncbi:uncharacterized protein LOC123559076 [Mercenaria mercenaria]|uniref:uncharacterized protein LOC123559076 n=1 Tax=Mercenaria mercenaria TaxID=6596 RepID=UPI00234EE844|nr:uncharacterized protein LOC123559076 [Mercenaria mercenaria]
MAANVPYTYLYRVLRTDEDVSGGIRAKRPMANYTIEEHVANGSYMSTQFISTTASLESAKDFARKSFGYTPGSRNVPRIDTSRLGQIVQYTDLTNSTVLYGQIPDDERAQNFARKFNEVVITGHIPANCIDRIFSV